MNILFLGAPGSGKGTQSKNIEEKFNIPQISTGDLLRAETASESKMGQELKNIMSSGKFVSDEIVLKLVSKKSEKHPELLINPPALITLIPQNKGHQNTGHFTDWFKFT